MIIRPDNLKEGQEGVIKNWVNQPDYIGCKLRLENSTLIITDKNGFESKHVDMRFPHWCKVELI